MIDVIGGPGRDRTDDLFHAMEARSQTAPQAHFGGRQLYYSLCCASIRQTCGNQVTGRFQRYDLWLAHLNEFILSFRPLKKACSK